MMRSSPFSFRTLVQLLLVLALIAGLLGYVAWQARFLIIGPVITLTNDPAFVQSERTVYLTGHARNISGITLNGRPIFTDSDGHFTEPVVLESGYTIATVTGTDRYGRERQVERSFYLKPGGE